MEQRRREAAKGLLKHSLFGFQAHDAVVSERLSELKDLLLATCGERDQIGLLSENIREIEEQLKSRSERFLLDPLRRFEQDMELLLDVGSGDEAEDVDEDSEDDDETEECLSLSQDPAIIATTPLSSPLPPVKPIKTKEKKAEDEEMLCGVCCAPDSLENDPIVICDVCGVAVHQTCYRLAAVPEGDWYCHPCRQYLDSQDIEKNLIPTHELECEVCCSKAGAMAPTIDGGWVHVACSMFLPELYVQEKPASRFQGPLDDLQVVCGVDKLKQRRKLRCCFCKKSNEKGACAQCAVGKCTVAYHALCALRNGIKLRYMEDQAYLVEFRKTREQKQKFLSSDVLMGVSSEPKDAEADVDEQTPLDVGTTVNVAKRTWPGMNKLGGVGRIKKVNEDTLPNGKKRFTYNVAYVLSGTDKNVERKYISVVDLEADEPDKNEETSSTSAGRRQESEPEADTKDVEEAVADTLSVRVVFALSRTAVEDNLAELPDAQLERPPKRRRFQLQFSTENETVQCKRIKEDSDPVAPTQELLLHRYFPVKVDDALVNECFSAKLLNVEDRDGEEVDEDDTDKEDESDEIKTELATLQNQFRAVMESNELAVASLTKKVEEEYASKEYRQQELQDIKWRNYERMYQELQAAKRQFADSDEESDADENEREPGSAATAESEEENSDNEDISFGGMFVNKLKQEGSEDARCSHLKRSSKMASCMALISSILNVDD
ncbi:hypothetical protein JG688_00014566 [Phytophthora aleatoria]|uniref:PHD-type domain-containing protein n=1 Tax=Phytophthora aleatoria TaxID=2496075 RepID=A0A8J5IBP6_9STRA|nr:hypothetical protein JG688_00014566 [Phytophthora aleatoria]